VSYTNGSRVGFFQGNVKKLIEDIQTLKPTMLFGVPRVFSKIYAKVFMGVSEKRWFERIGFSIGYNKQCQLCRVGFERSEKWDRKIFIPLRTRLGLDRCKVILTGAAPCPPYLVEFLRVIVGAKVVQGYGMTETSAAISICKLDHVPIGHCGPPLACNDVRLCDVPEMNYTSADRPFPRGEICIRGPNMFKGYYKNKSATEKTIVDGWLHTGDIGRWNPSGSLSIIDRKKNIFKMSQGEYIAAEKIELAYGKCALVGQIWVYGNSFKSFIVAVVVPNAEALVKVCTEKGWWSKDVVIGSDEFRDEFHSLMTGAHAAELKKIIFTAMKDFQNDLKGFEKLRDIMIESRLDVMLSGFNEGNGCLTPTFKLKRPALLRRYIKDLKDLYAQNGEPAMAQEVWPGEQ
jgi:long-chain acyl-CoA synthetase